MSQGIIYLVSGGRSYLGELRTSLESLRRVEPDLPVTVFSRFPLPRGTKADFQKIDSPEHPLKLKVLTLSRSPYERTIFLDTDITLRGPVSPLFSGLDDHDFCVANSHEADWSVRPPRFVAMVKPRDYNTGVLVYRKSSPAMGRFLGRWEEAVMAQDSTDMWAGHNCDQTHFNRLVAAGALEDSGVRLKELDNVVYNCRGTMLDAVVKAGRAKHVVIFHHRTMAMKLSKLAYSAMDPQTAVEIGKKIARQLKLR
jgi:hypothetical protein